MKSLMLTVSASDVEEVLDRVMPLATHGVHEFALDEQAELLMFGTEEELPSPVEVSALCGNLIRAAVVAEAPDSWQERRRATHRPLVVAGRISIRPDWAPPAVEVPIDVVLYDEGSFGGGRHPTTRACLELLVGLEPRGGLADLGCGSGVLAIAAAMLGWSPVSAVDADPASVEATRTNAACNSVELDIRQCDLLTATPPAAQTLVANVPPAVHESIAARLTVPPARLIATGALEDEATALMDCYRSVGLTVEERRLDEGWASILCAGSP